MANVKGWIAALGALFAAAGGFVAGAMLRDKQAAPPLPTTAPAHPGFPPMSLAPAARG